MPGNLWLPERARQWTAAVAEVPPKGHLSDERLWNCVVVEHSTVFSSIPTSSVQYHKHSTVFSSIPTSIVQYHKHSTVFTVFTVLHYSRLSAALIVTDLNLVCITLLHYYLSTILK